MTTLTYIDAHAVNRLLDYPGLVDSLRDAFLSPPLAPERLSISYGAAGDQHLLVMPAVNPAGIIGVKLVTFHPALARRPGGAVRALYVAMDAATGEPRALIDGAALTERRTAAASVLAARALARPDPSVLLVIGTGQVAHALCHAYAAVLRPRRILVWGRRTETARDLVARLEAEGVAAAPAEDLGAAVRAADIVSAATLAAEPLVLGADVRPGTHVDLVGGFTPTMREADDALIARAIVVADGPGALDTAGDLTQPIAAGILERGSVRLLGDVLAGRAPGRETAQDVTLFKSVGLALEDLAAAERLLATGPAQ